MVDIDFSNMKEIFIDDTSENIEIITDKILTSERENNIETDVMNEVLRLCHSIKGASRMLKLSSIAKTFHDLETLLKNVKEKKIPFEKYVIDLFLEGMDTIKDALELMRENIDAEEFFEVDMFNQKLSIMVSSDEEEEETPAPAPTQQVAVQAPPPNDPMGKIPASASGEIDVDALMNAATAPVETPPVQTAPAVSPVAPTPPPPAAPPAVVDVGEVTEPEETFSYENCETEILSDFVEESSELVETLANDFIEIEEDCSPQVIDRIFRGMHTLKGGAGFVGMIKFQELAHTCENILDDVRNNKYQITTAIINEMLKANDIFALFLNLLNNNQPLSVSIGENLKTLKMLKANKGVLGVEDKVLDVTPQVKQDVVNMQNEPAAEQPSQPIQKVQPVETKTIAAPVSEVQQPAPVQNVQQPAPVTPPPSKPAAPSKSIKPVSKPVSPSAKSSSPAKPKTQGQLTQQTLRVSLQKLDNLMNLVGELVINKIGFSSQLEKISVYIDEIEENMHHINLHLENADLKHSLDLYEKFQKGFSEFALKNKNHPELKELNEFLKDYSLLFGDTNIINKLYENWKTMVVEYQQISTYYLDLYNSSTILASKIGLLAKDLQENVMQTRMLPIASVFNKYKRTVRDLAQKVGKEIKLEIYGEETEMDKTIIEKINDPLTHIVRNSIDHGLETPEERLAMGKSRAGTIILRAYNKGGSIYIEVEDDGNGIDADKIANICIKKGLINQERVDVMSETEKLNLIFIAGFSTAEKVTEISGRGVGMDVVRENITKLKGIIDIKTKLKKGTTLTIKLPLTLAILQVLQIKEDGDIFAIPSNNIIEVFSTKINELEKVKDVYMINNRGKFIPIYFLTDVLGLRSAKIQENQEIEIIIVGFGNNLVGLIISEIIKKEEVVIKNLGDIVKKVKYVSGATIEGDGSITLILNIPEMIDALREGENVSAATRSFEQNADSDSEEPKKTKRSGKKRIMTVEDSVTTRKMIKSIIESGGYEVFEGVDGIDGVEKLKNNWPIDLVTVDVNMPRLNGYGFTQEVRKHSEYEKLPIIMITTRDLEVDKVKGFEAGVDDYIVKPFDPGELLTVIKQYIK